MKIDKSIIKCVVFDLDGTIYFGRELAERANEVISYAREKYGSIAFATNNSALKREKIFERLTSMGIKDIEVNDVMNSTYIIPSYLKSNGIDRVWSIGTNDLKEELYEQGINPSSSEPQAIVIGYNPNFNLLDIEEALKVYSDDCKIIVANLERSYPKSHNIMTPGCGAIVASFCHTVNREVDVILGKPEPDMLLTVANEKKVLPENILMIGDSFISDIVMANRIGAQSIWINSNTTNNSDNEVQCLKQILSVI